MFNDVMRTWDQWAGSGRGAQVLRRWRGCDSALDGWTLAELRSPVSSARTDAMQAALVRLAQQGDAAAAATLTVQLRPGLSRLVRWALGADHRFWSAGEAAAEVLGVFSEILMGHCLARRPGKVAANLLYDTRQRIWRTRSREARTRQAALAAASVPPAEPSPLDRPDTVTGELDLVAAVSSALEQLAGSETSRRLTAELAYRAWILDQPSKAIAHELGMGREAVSSRLCRLRAIVRQAHRGAAHDASSRSDGSAPPASPVGPSLASRQ
jgi:hypothetical protein